MTIMPEDAVLVRGKEADGSEATSYTSRARALELVAAGLLVEVEPAAAGEAQFVIRPDKTWTDIESAGY